MTLLKRLRLGLSLSLAMLLSPVFAQESNPKSIADNWIMVAKDGQQEKFEAAFVEHLKFRKKHGDPRQWHVYTPTVGDDLNHYVVRSCCMSWGDFDDYSKWGTKNKIGEHFRKNVGKYVASYKHHLVKLDFENSHWPENTPPHKYYGVVTYSPRMGHAKDIQDGIKTIGKEAKAMKWDRLWMWGWRVGGEGALSLVFPFENFDAMKPPKVSFMENFAKQYGGEEKASAFFKKWGKSFKTTDYTIYRHRPELSMSE